MLPLLRKFVVVAVIAVIAAAGMTSPQLALASSHSAQIVVVPNHDHHTGHAHTAGATTPCDEHGPCTGKASLTILVVRASPSLDVSFPS